MKNIKKYQPLILFILGFGIFIFTRLSKLVPTIPVTIFISFVFILRFSRTQTAAKGIWLTLFGFILSINTGLWGLFEVGENISSLMFNLIRSTLLAILYFLPFMIDRLTFPKFKKYGPASTLVFPVITTAVFYLLTIEGPFEGAIQTAKFVFGTLQFKQFLSLFGGLGFVFFTSWLASAVNHLWEKNFEWKKSKKLIILFTSIIGAVYLFGAVKTSSIMAPGKETVKVAGILIEPSWGKTTPMEKVFAEKITSPFGSTLLEIENKIKEAAASGAKIAAFMEFAMMINEEDQEKLREELSRISVENDIFTAMSYGYYAKKGKGENKFILLDNEGKLLIDYSKKYLLGLGDLGETRVFKKGPEILQYADTPYGKITLTVCREMEMEKYMIQAAKAGVDIMFSSAYEWPKTWLPNNLQMPVINGFSLVRVAYNGVSHSQDYNGKMLDRMYFEDTDNGIMYTEIPTKGVKTLYSFVGKMIGWLSAIGLVVLILFSIIKKDKKKN